MKRIFLICALIVSGCSTGGGGANGGVERAEARGDEVTSRDRCLLIRNLTGWAAVDDDTLVLWAPRHRPYKVEVTGACWNLDSIDTLKLLPGSGTGSMCTGINNFMVTIGYNGARTRCRLGEIKALSLDEAHALLRGDPEERAIAGDQEQDGG